MMRSLRSFLSSVLALAATVCWAQAPLSGTYHIKGVNGKYVAIQGKYYAQPNATTQSDYTKITLGVGYNTGDGYRVYSLQGKNPTDGSTIEVYDYIQKACNIVSQFGQEKMNGKIGTLLEKYFSGDENAELRENIAKGLDAMADSICRIYTDAYAYMTLVPEGHYGDKWVVRAKATVPEIPYSIQSVGDYYTKGHVVITGHECTGVWDWAKQHVLKYLQTHSTNYQLKNLVEVYLDQVEPGMTYYLTCEDNETFGYATSKTDAGLWTLEPVFTVADGLAHGTYNIQNKSTQYFVNVTGKYAAAPNLTQQDIQSNATNRQNAAIGLDFGRYTSNKNLYRITELSNGDIDAVSYINKGMNKVYEILDKKLKEKDLYKKLADKLNGKTGDDLTEAELSADVKTAIDLCTLHYAYLNLVDNTDGTVSLYVDVPEVPYILNLAAVVYQQTFQGKGNDDIAEAPFEDMVKEQLDKYFNDVTSNTDQHLRNLWKQNRDKWNFGHRYYLAADNFNTFDYVETMTDAAKWVLAKVEDYDAETNPNIGYFRVKNVGGYKASDGDDLQQYVEVKGRASADVATTSAEKYTKAGTIMYINLSADSKNISAPYDVTKTVKAYEVLDLRSQGVDVLGGAEASMDELKEVFEGSVSFDNNKVDVTGAYNGYVGFARYMLWSLSQLGSSHIAAHAADYPAVGTAQDCQTVLDDFINNYLPELKMQVYMIPVTGQANTYYIRSKVPSLAPITHFYKANKTAMDKVVIPSVDRFLKYQNDNKGYLDKIGYTGEYFTYQDEGTVRSWNGSTFGLWDYAEKDGNSYVMYNYDTEKKEYVKAAGGKYYRLPYSTILGNEWVMFNWLKLQAWHALEKMGYSDNASIKKYIGLVHYDTPYYLIQGSNTDSSNNRNYTGSAKLGFANDGSVSDTYNDLSKAGNHAYWTLEPVDADNYFAVKPNKNQGKNGKYYSSVYVDFPFKAAGDNVTAIYTLNETDGTVKSGTDAVTSETIKYVSFDKVDGTVEAAKPVVVEFAQNTVDKNIALVPVVGGDRYTKQTGDIVQGTFFGGYHNVTLDLEEGDGKMVALKNMLKKQKNGSIADKYGVDTDGKDLYLFGYNKNDNRNPYGFYLYSSSTETGGRNIIPGNKPFLILDPSNSAAKVYVLFGDNEATAIDGISSDDTTTTYGDADIYNLSGQRVNSSYKGVVIMKGKKYINK